MPVLRTLLGLAAATAAATAAAFAAQLPDGSYADLLVIPVGPVPLAEFTANQPPTAAGPNANSNTKSPAQAPARQTGSGITVKQQDPAEIPPRAIYLKRDANRYFKIPCYFNAVAIPVRIPVADSDLTFLLKSDAAKDSFEAIVPCKLPAPRECVIVLLTKPLAEKRWTRPQVTLIPLAASTRPRLVIVNASQSASCAAVINGAAKFLVPPLLYQAWEPPPDAADTPPTVALAMAPEKNHILPPFYQNTITLANSATHLLISYDVTPRESFRGAKFVAGSFKSGEFRPPAIYPGG